MNKKRMIPIFLTILLALTCCSCSPKPETPEQVVEKMQTAMTETPLGKAQIVMDMTISLDAGDGLGVQEIATTLTNDIIVSQEPVSGYTSSTIEMSYGGVPVQTVAESYSIIEDGEVVAYTHSSGNWMKVSTGQTIEELKNSASAINIDISNAAIDETVTDLDGKEVICLTTQISGASLEGLLGGMLDGMGLDSSTMTEAADVVSAFDFSAITCDTKIFLDKETYLPISEEMNFTGMGDMMAPLYSSLEITVDVPTCTATASYLSYEPQEEITLPEGAAEKAVSWNRRID